MRFKPPDNILTFNHLILDPLNTSDPLLYLNPFLFGQFGYRLFDCKGDGGGDGIDKEYNARMATIYENQNEWANEFNDFWADYENPYEVAKLDANQRMLEGDTALAIETTAAEREALPYQTEQATAEAQYGAASAKSAMELLPMQTNYEKERLTTATEKEAAMRPVQDKYFSEALDGVDADSWAANAQADAAGAFMASTSGTEMAMARRGAAPGSGAYAGQQNESAMGRAMTLGKAATGGRESGERESFSRLSGAMSYGD